MIRPALVDMQMISHNDHNQNYHLLPSKRDGEADTIPPQMPETRTATRATLATSAMPLCRRLILRPAPWRTGAAGMGTDARRPPLAAALPPIHRGETSL